VHARLRRVLELGEHEQRLGLHGTARADQGVLAGDVGELGRRLVLGNQVIFGTVNANRGHYEQAAAALAAADRNWLDSVITRRVALEEAAGALEREPDDIKVVVELGGAAA
jgi:hypothetical protein